MAKRRIEIGIVALSPEGAPHDGVHHAGPKVYKTEKLARAALRNKGKAYEFTPAFIEVEEKE